MSALFVWGITIYTGIPLTIIVSINWKKCAEKIFILDCLYKADSKSKLVGQEGGLCFFCVNPTIVHPQIM